MMMAPPPTADSAVSPCFHGYLAFLHRHFSPQPPSSPPLDPFLHSQQQPLPWDCSTLPSQTPTPSHCAFQETSVPVRGMHGCSKDCRILIPFRRPQVSCFTLGLKCFSSDSDNRPAVGIGPWLQFPHPLRAGPVLLTPLFFPPSSFIQQSFVWFYTVFSTGQVLLPVSAGVLHALLCLKVCS